MRLPTDNLRWWAGPQRHRGDVYQPRFALKSSYSPLYLLNHAYDGVRCGAPTVIREAPLEYQTMVCSQKLYNQRLATLSTYHHLTPVSRRHHIYAVGGRGGAMLYKRGFLTGRTPYPFSDLTFTFGEHFQKSGLTTIHFQKSGLTTISLSKAWPHYLQPNKIR